jgi:hypothetical protein
MFLWGCTCLTNAFFAFRVFVPRPGNDSPVAVAGFIFGMMTLRLLPSGYAISYGRPGWGWALLLLPEALWACSIPFMLVLNRRRDRRTSRTS